MSSSNTKPCEWCDKPTTTRCSGCNEIHICSRACMKLIWKEHKRTCQKKKATIATACTATDALVQEVSKVTAGKRSLWLKLQGPEQKLIAEYMDVVSMCRMDSAMTGREERKEWQKALKSLQ